MTVFNDQIITRYQMLTGEAETGLVGLMQKLGLVETKAIRAKHQINNIMKSGRAGGDFGLVFNKDFDKQARELRELDSVYNQVFSQQGTSSGKAFAQNLIDEISKGSTQQLPSKGDLLKGIGDEVKEGVGQVSQLAKQLGMAAGNGADVSAQVRMINHVLKNSPNEMKMFNTQLKNATHHAKNMARIGKMFGFLFGGMQLQRIGLSITRFVLPAMDKVENYTSRGTRQVNAMRASFEFLKFSMFETFTQTPLFQKFVDLVITATNWLSEMVAKHPMLVQVAAALGGVAVVLGTLAMGAGIFNQFAMMASYLGVGKPMAKAPSLIAGADKLKNALNKVGLGISIATIGLSLQDMMVNISKGDIGGAIGSGIATALGIGGAAAFLLGAGPLGWVLTISGAIVLGVTKITTDTRRATAAAKDLLGVSSNPLNDFIDGFFGNQNLQASGFNKGIAQFTLLSQEIQALETQLQKTSKSDAQAIIFTERQLLDAREELKGITQSLYTIDSERAQKTMQDIQLQIRAQNDAATATKEVSAEYPLLIQHIATSKTETESFTNNVLGLLDLINGDTMKTAITNLYKIDELWNQAQESLSNFSRELDEWAKKIVVKTVQIKYEEINRPSGTSGFFERSGAKIDSFVSSVTGGGD